MRNYGGRHARQGAQGFERGVPAPGDPMATTQHESPLPARIVETEQGGRIAGPEDQGLGRVHVKILNRNGLLGHWICKRDLTKFGPWRPLSVGPADYPA